MFKKINALIFTLIILMFAVSAYADGVWSKNISLGYNKSTGNTEKSEASASLEVKKTLETSVLLGKANTYYSSSNKKMDSQKWTALISYSLDFEKGSPWFSTYKVTADHDRFADIDYRITPFAGVGYWFEKSEDYNLMSEVSLGYEMTGYRSAKADDDEMVAVARAYFDKKIFDDSTISEDVSVIPSLEGGGTRVTSETAFTNPLAEGLDLSVKFIVDYDTEPAAGIKKTDTRLVTGLKYSF